jgi:hypothetical protein
MDHKDGASVSLLEIIHREGKIAMLFFFSGRSDAVIYIFILFINFNVDIGFSKLRPLIILVEIMMVLLHYVT